MSAASAAQSNCKWRKLQKQEKLHGSFSSKNSKKKKKKPKPLTFFPNCQDPTTIRKEAGVLSTLLQLLSNCYICWLHTFPTHVLMDNHHTKALQFSGRFCFPTLEAAVLPSLCLIPQGHCAIHVPVPGSVAHHQSCASHLRSLLLSQLCAQEGLSPGCHPLLPCPRLPLETQHSG